MTEFSKRPEVTIETMGRVHNPSGEGIKAVSSEVKNKTKLNKQSTASNPSSLADLTGTVTNVGTRPGPQRRHYLHTSEDHETSVKEEGTSRRNITRKKHMGDVLHDNKKKKQGGSGKGKWGEANDGSDYYPTAIDPNDPLYDVDDTEAEGKFVLSSSTTDNNAETAYDPVADRVVYGPLLTLPEFKLRLTEALKEYFDSGDTDEVIRSLEEMKCVSYHAEVVKRAVSLSLDEGPRERELISRLLTCLHPYPLSDQDIEVGFDLLLDSLNDLSIDIPDAKIMVGCFLARGIVDEVLPPSFVSKRNNLYPGDEVVEKALSLLTREHCTARLEKVWGPGDGRPVAELKTVIDQLIEEYLQSRELDEAARCVKELNAPHFHHELIKRGVKIAMEKDGLDHKESQTSSLDAIAALFSFLVKNAIISEHQVAKGISRLYRSLKDLKLDVPAAPAMLEEFEKMAFDGGCLKYLPK